MNILLKRIWFTEYTTISRAFIKDESICYILEDPLRKYPNKVKGDTCIWGNRTYKIVIDYSPKFKKHLPHILDVPLFTGIRIHPGNGPEDTEGCLLPGLIRESNRVLYSRSAFKVLLGYIQDALNMGDEVTITIVNPQSIKEIP